MKLFIYFVVASLLTTFVGCNSISSDPEKGAEELTELLIHSEESNNIKEAHEFLSRYWDAYAEKERNVFLLALYNKLISQDKIVYFIASQDFHTYPLCGMYLQNILQTQLSLAIEKPSSNWASKGILFGSILADYADSRDISKASELIIRTHDNLKSTAILNRIVFFYTFQHYIKDSGLSGQKAFKLISELRTTEIDNFKLLAIESTIDFD